MARFAPVAPIHLLEAFKLYDQLGSYHLLLAHDILKHKEEYRNTFAVAPWGSPIPGYTVILDNSVIELGTAVSIDTILEAAEAVHPTVIVLPDVLGAAQATIEGAHNALINWTHKINQVLGVGKWTYMVVPQGKNLEEFIWCAQQFKGNPMIGWWSVPRHMTAKLGARTQATALLHKLNPHKKIHLLGFSDNLLDDIITSQLPMVTGIDSAVPIRAATYGFPFEPVIRNLPPRGGWWDDASSNGYVPLMLKNLIAARELFMTPTEAALQHVGFDSMLRTRDKAYKAQDMVNFESGEIRISSDG